MYMPKRYELSEQQWARIAETLPRKKSNPGQTAQDNRLFVDGVLWVLRSGAHWDELPERYGKRKNVHTRWAKSGVWERVFAALIDDPKNEYLMLDATLVRAHYQAAARKGAAKRG
jgi:transposase